VSFAGVPAFSFKGCASLECDAQGISAEFVDDQLVYLSYGVRPFSTKEIITALKSKFGTPTEETEKSATWRNSVGYLWVDEVSVPGRNGVGAMEIATAIVSALNDKGQNKDI
jgi:hypothetical protein